MIQNVLKHIGGIEHYGILSLILFLACFLGMLVWALLLRKPDLNEVSRLPLESDPENPENGTHDHE